MSKFDYNAFYGDCDEFAVNAEKYSVKEAIEIFEKETDCKVGNDHDEYVIFKTFVKWRYGVWEGEPMVGWWIENFKRKKGSCPVYAFKKRCYFDKDYDTEIIQEGKK